jgi:hypothetical protein
LWLLSVSAAIGVTGIILLIPTLREVFKPGSGGAVQMVMGSFILPVVMFLGLMGAAGILGIVLMLKARARVPASSEAGISQLSVFAAAIALGVAGVTLLTLQPYVLLNPMTVAQELGRSGYPIWAFFLGVIVVPLAIFASGVGLLGLRRWGWWLAGVLAFHQILGKMFILKRILGGAIAPLPLQNSLLFIGAIGILIFLFRPNTLNEFALAHVSRSRALAVMLCIGFALLVPREFMTPTR